MYSRDTLNWAVFVGDFDTNSAANIQICSCDCQPGASRARPHEGEGLFQDRPGEHKVLVANDEGVREVRELEHKRLRVDQAARLGLSGTGDTVGGNAMA